MTISHGKCIWTAFELLNFELDSGLCIVDRTDKMAMILGLLKNWDHNLPLPCPSFQVDYRCWTTMPHIRKWMRKQGALGRDVHSLDRTDLGDENGRFGDG